jgi:NOL1/NOP2/fmu family ribosome biogenesis protein
MMRAVSDEGGEKPASPRLKRLQTGDSFDSIKELDDFFADNMTSPIKGPFQIFGTKVIRAATDEDGKSIDTAGLRVARSGWYIGDMKNGRFDPSQPLAMGIKKGDFKRVIDLRIDDHNVVRYLKGETVTVDGEDGLNLVCVEGHPLGFGKLKGSTLKNLYNKAWRLI